MKSTVCVGSVEQLGLSMGQRIGVSVNGGVGYMDSCTDGSLEGKVRHRVDIDQIRRNIPRLLTGHWR